MSQLFAWGGRSIGVSASTSVLLMNTQDWSPLEWSGWIFLQSRGLSRVFSNTAVQKHRFFSTQVSYGQTLTSIHEYSYTLNTFLTHKGSSFSLECVLWIPNLHSSVTWQIDASGAVQTFIGHFPRVPFVFLSVIHGCFGFQHLVLTMFLDYRLSSKW